MTRFDKVIPPGSEGKIYASVDIGHSKGPVQKLVDIKTNDPKRPDAKVVIKATIKTLVDVQPTEQIRFSVSKGTLKTMDLFLMPDPSVKLLPPVVRSELISAKLTPDKNGRQKLTVDLKKSDIIGTHATEIQIPVEGPIKEVIVPVIIMVQGPLQVTPRIISFVLKGYPEEVLVNESVNVMQAADPAAAVVEKVAAGRKLKVINESKGWLQVITFQKEGTAQSVPVQRIGWVQSTAVKPLKLADLPDPQEISIQISNGKTFHVLDLRSTLPSVKVDKKAAGSNPGTYQLTVRLLDMDRNKKGNTRGEIVVNTDNVDQPQLKIPVFINVM